MGPPRRRHRAAGLLVGLLGSALVLSACFSSGPSKPAHTTPPVAMCPLMGTPAPGGRVPQRPAVIVKVDNYSQGVLPISPPYARPQAGLDHADVIFEEQVEGAITRYLAVFQCREAPLVGDVRSARELDIGIASELSHPLLVHVGGIAPVLTNIDHSTITNVDLGYVYQLLRMPAGRYPPYDDFVSTASVWQLYRNRTSAPTPIFTYSKYPLAGRRVSQIHLDWSTTSDIYWRWDKSTGTWLRYYDNAAGAPGPAVIQPDVLQNGIQDQAQNVVVQVVHISFGPWLENFEGGREVEAPIANSSGRAYVFRNGTMIPGIWVHHALTSPTVFETAKGKVIHLAPGRTWVEVYPSIDPISVTFGTIPPA
jgi:hypothetical protein